MNGSQKREAVVSATKTVGKFQCQTVKSTRLEILAQIMVNIQEALCIMVNWI